ncbi:MAG: putative DNA binding domain-containing protein [Bryobacterales bacterium]|nr:putative DNA binding domain-containing protein [Bryobacterales bacterium]
MITEEQLLELLADKESFRVERTTSTTDTAKFSEAVCAFANDMPGARLPGYLVIGAHDKTGAPSGLTVTDELLRNLAALATDGNILPAPALSVFSFSLPSGAGDIAVVEVQPSDLPPVRYKQRIWIRRGPRKALANETEESLLIERRTDAARTFDARPCIGAALADLSLDLFTNSYRHLAVDPDIIEENHRPIEQQLASLRFFDLSRNCPTYAGILLFAQDALAWLPNAYIQFVRFDGTTLDTDVLNEKTFQGDLLSVVQDLNSFVKLLTTQRPAQISAIQESIVSDYPVVALRELLLNAILHRSYEAPAPVRFYQYSDRIEIQNPGPLYGLARQDNFPTQTSYRNPVLAEALKTLGFINRFGRGVERARAALAKNGNPSPSFTFGENHFGVTIWSRL